VATVHVVSPVDGRVVEILVEPRQVVSAGDPLALIQCPDGPPPTRLHNAEAELVAAEHDLETHDHPSPAGRALAEDRVAQARREVDAAREAARQSATPWREGAYVVRAPSAGTVQAARVTVGAPVRGSYHDDATTLFVLGVSEADAAAR
jgi:biotin carboxyl carrier protein